MNLTEGDDSLLRLLLIMLHHRLYTPYDYTVEPVCYGHLGTSQKCPDYQGVLIFQVSLHDNVSFGTTARCVDYAGVHIFKCPD